MDKRKTKTQIDTEVASVKKGLPDGKTRATFILEEANLEGIKNMAYWDRTGINDLINTIIRDCIKFREKRVGKLKPRPEKK